MGTKFLDFSGTQLLVDHLKADIIRAREETDNLACTLNASISAYSSTTDELENRIAALEDQMIVACADLNLLRSQMDALIEKPKQKYLWEIFEPNDLDIDFIYNL